MNNCTIVGDFFNDTSMAHVLRNVCRAIQKSGIDVRIIPTSTFNGGQGEDLLQYETDVPIGKVLLQCLFHYRRIEHRFTKGAALLMTTETNTIPITWKNMLSTYYHDIDIIFVPCQECKSMLHNNGVVKRTEVGYFHGVDTSIFNPNVRPAELPGGFKFLDLGGIDPWRKGDDILLKAFCEEFSGSEDVHLYFKASLYGDHFSSHVQQCGNPNVHYIYDNVKYSDVARYYTACDCFVHPFRAGGFELTPLEAMACGLPVIATNAAGILEYGEYCLKIPYKDVNAQYGFGSHVQPATVKPVMWHEPDKGVLKKHLRFAYENREKLKNLGIMSANLVKKEWTWENKCSKLVAWIKE